MAWSYRDVSAYGNGTAIIYNQFCYSTHFSCRGEDQFHLASACRHAVQTIPSPRHHPGVPRVVVEGLSLLITMPFFAASVFFLCL